MQAEPPAEPTVPTDLHPMAQAFVDAHAAIAPKVAEQNTAHVVNLLEGFERDIGPLIAPIAQQLLDNPDTPPELHALLGVLVQPTHFGESVIIGIAIGSILSPVLANAFAPITQGIANTAWGINPSQPIPVAVAVASKLKNVLGPNDPATEAVQSGINLSRFNQMVEAAGNALGFEEALSLSRRNLLTGITLDQVLEYSNVNPKFYAAAKNLITNPVSVAEVLNARIRTHLDDGQATDLYAQAGGIPDQYAWRLASTGRPPGPMEVGTLFNRGKIDDAVASRMLAQSDLALAFQDSVKELWHYYPPPRSLVPMLRADAITDAQFTTWMSYYGAPPDVVDAFRKEATSTKASAGKDLTQAQVTRLYGAQVITRAEATTRLTALGLPADDVTLLLDYEDNLRPEKLMNALISKVSTLYISHKITKPDATTALSAGKVPAAAVQQLFAIWDIERTANVYFPTPAGIVGALRRGIITPVATHRRLNALGVLDSDIPIVVGDGWPPTAPQDAKAAVVAVLNDDAELLSTVSGSKSPHKALTPTQITKEYLTSLITRAQAITQLEGLGYNATDADALLTLAGPPTVVTP